MERPGAKSLPHGGESSSSSRRDYEVFLSFRGPDTRLTFTDSLYASMIRAGIHVFKDDEELRVGEEIGGELLEAISNSKIYIPIFSKDYASSKWCLRELLQMLEHKNRDGKVILPIFYEVDASDLKRRTGSYGKALRKHERQSGESVAKQWEEALREVAKIKGWNLKDHGQDKLIALVLKEVLYKLRRSQTNWLDDLVGIHHRMEAVTKLLGQGTPDVRFVVIHGMGGIGKTTLAKAVFKSISSQFQSSSFLSDVRANEILSLQRRLLRDVLGIRGPDISDHIVGDEDEGMDMIKRSLSDKKVIVVLDDMDKRDQLMKLAQKSYWFGSGSRIIITTRNTYFLALETDALDDNIIPEQDFFFYEMKEMQFDHALQLFSKHSSPPHDYSSISSKIVKYTGGLPLALVVIGSFLHLKSKETWKDTLKKLKEVPNQDVQKKLLISYEELDCGQRQIFLDVACHCIGEKRIPAYYMWKASGFFPKTGLRVLIRLSLIKIVKDDSPWDDYFDSLFKEFYDNDLLWMHDQLRDLGREIVRQEGIHDPRKRSRLWCPTVALNVIQNNMEKENIVALKLLELADEHNFTSDEFSRLPSLRFLELDGGNFVGDFKNLLSNLTWLSWRYCPSSLHATNLHLRNLAVLKISESDITEDWNGWESCMVSDNLKVVYLTSCEKLERTPDFSKCLKMRRLVVNNCSSLEEINSSIGCLGRLKYLEVDSWSGWEDKRSEMDPPPLIPKSIGGLKSLSTLNLENLMGVRELPPSIGELLGLKSLSLRGCSKLEKLPNSIGKLRSLLYLNLTETSISGLPDSIGGLESLLKIYLFGTPIAKLPNSIGNLGRLKVMHLGKTKIRALPKIIWTLENLEDFSASGCENLEGEIPSEIGRLSQLKILDLSGSKVSGLPTTINRLCGLRELVLSECNCLQSLPDLPISLTKLELSSSSLQAVPNLSNQTSLLHLEIKDRGFDRKLSKMMHGRVSNPNLEWLGRLHELQTLRLVLSDSNLPPLDLSSLSRLRELEISCFNTRSLGRLPSSLEDLMLNDVEIPIEWPMLSHLGNLSTLILDACRLREIEFDDVLGRLENLRCLVVWGCESLMRLSNLLSLKELRNLRVEGCPQLIEIEPGPSSAGHCDSTERLIPETPKLEKLQVLHVYHCGSLRKLPDLPDACAFCVSGCPSLPGTENGRLRRN